MSGVQSMFFNFTKMKRHSKIRNSIRTINFHAEGFKFDVNLCKPLVIDVFYFATDRAPNRISLSDTVAPLELSLKTCKTFSFRH